MRKRKSKFGTFFSLASEIADEMNILVFFLSCRFSPFFVNFCLFVRFMLSNEFFVVS